VAELINLRRARKARARDAAAREADANRIRHGTPKALTSLADARADLEARKLDGARREAAPAVDGMGAAADESDPPA
jgi:hypothetical protein